MPSLAPTAGKRTIRACLKIIESRGGYERLEINMALAAPIAWMEFGLVRPQQPEGGSEDENQGHRRQASTESYRPRGEQEAFVHAVPVSAPLPIAAAP